jgi:hypothetical protein
LIYALYSFPEIIVLLICAIAYIDFALLTTFISPTTTKVVVNFKTFTATMFQVEALWVVMPHRVVVQYQHFRGPCCFHLQDEVTGMEEDSIDIGPDWRDAAGAISQQEVQRE